MFNEIKMLRQKVSLRIKLIEETELKLKMHIILGIIFIVFGILTIIFTYQNPDSQLSSFDWKGYIGGFCAIIIGICMILNRFTL